MTHETPEPEYNKYTKTTKCAIGGDPVRGVCLTCGRSARLICVNNKFWVAQILAHTTESINPWVEEYRAAVLEGRRVIGP